MSLNDAFNTLLRLQSRPATLRRLGSPNVDVSVRISPTNYFSKLAGPSDSSVFGKEFIFPASYLTSTVFSSNGPKRGDQLIDATFGTLTVEDVVPCYGLGAQLIGWRVRTE